MKKISYIIFITNLLRSILINPAKIVFLWVLLISFNHSFLTLVLQKQFYICA